MSGKASTGKLGQKQARDIKTGRFLSKAELTADQPSNQPSTSSLALPADATMSQTQVITDKPSSPVPKPDTISAPLPKSPTESVYPETVLPVSSYPALGQLGTYVEKPLKGDQYYANLEFVFPAAISRNDYYLFDYDKKELADRVDSALKCGSNGLGKDLSENRYRHLSRLEETKTFKDVIESLNWLLTSVVKYSDNKEIEAFTLQRPRARTLNFMLAVKKAEAKDDLVIKGNGIPGLPVWGIDGNLNHYWSANDFEILAAVYRAEVEMFLAELADAHTFEVPEKSSRKKEDHKPTDINVPPEHRTEPESISQVTMGFSTTQRGKTFGYSTAGSSSGKRWKDIMGNNNPDKDLPPHMPEPKDKGKKDENDEEDSKDPPNPPRKEDDQRPRKGHSRHKPPPDSPDPSDSDNDSADNRRGPFKNRNDRTPRNSHDTNNTPKVPEFDNRLKVDIIPTWDGNIDELGRWMLKINRLSERSPTVFQQLGVLVPTRLSGTADTWYYSLSVDTRNRIEQNWGTLREAIGNYFMNRTYINKQKIRANKATFRDYAHAKELPTEYYIRKLELLELVYDYTDAELINEIMSGAPSFWVSILTPHLYNTLEEFQIAIKFHEENLIRASTNYGNNPYRFNAPPTKENTRNPFNNYKSEARAHLVGWSPRTTNPPFPKDDANISPRGTPVSKGGRPCRHCGSDNHWDPECKYARKGEKRARVNVAVTEPEDISAQEEYDELYYGCVSDDENDRSDF